MLQATRSGVTQTMLLRMGGDKGSRGKGPDVMVGVTEVMLQRCDTESITPKEAGEEVVGW